MPELKASPRNRALGLLADAMDSAKTSMNSINVPLLGPLGDLVLAKATNEANDWSYGNSPFTMPASGVGGYIPVTKNNRRESLADAVNFLAGVDVAKPVVQAAGRAAKTVANPMTYGRAFMEAQAPAVVSRVVPLKQRTLDISAVDPAKATDYKVVKGAADIADTFPLDLDAHRGSILTTFMTDTSSRGMTPVNVSGTDIPKKFQIETEGGYRFATDRKNIEDKRAYASKASAVESTMRKLSNLLEMYPQSNGKVIVAPYSMMPSGINFSTQPVELIRSMAKSRELDPAKVGEIDDQIRSVLKGKYKDFVGLLHPDFEAQMVYGNAPYLSDLRKQVVDSFVMKRKGQELLDVDPNDFYAALTDPDLIGKRPYQVGNAFMTIDPRKPVLSGNHKTYDVGYPGEYIGSLPAANVEEVFPEIQQLNSALLSTPDKNGNFLPTKTAFLNAVNTYGWGKDKGIFLDDQNIERLKNVFNMK